MGSNSPDNLQASGGESALTVWRQRLSALEQILVVAYALVLPLPISYVWAILIPGLIVWLAIGILSIVDDKARGSTLSFSPAGILSLPLLAPLIAFAICVTLSGAVNGGAGEAMKSLFSLRTFIVYFWAYSAFQRYARLKMPAVLGLLFVGALSGLFGAFQQLADFHPFGFRYLQGHGFLSSPMPFSGQMQIFSLLSTAVILRHGYQLLAKPFNNKFVFALLLAANWLGLLFAGERSAWLGAIVGFTALCGVISWKSMLKSLLVIAVASGIALATVPVVQKRVQPLFSYATDPGATVRFQVWEKSYQLFRDHPLLGVGVRAFPHLYIAEAAIPGYKSFLDHAHSNYFHVLATTGAAGFLVYLWLLLATVKESFGLARKKVGEDEAPGQFDSALALGVFGAVVSLAVSGIFEYNFGTGQVRLTQWFVIALLAQSRVNQSSPERPIM
ncbi:MAG TPA: O-antigen ligase family protein [Candidatus Obscuribacterales bacterium]